MCAYIAQPRLRQRRARWRNVEAMELSRPPLLRAAAAVCIAGLTACTGAIGDPGASDGDPATPDRPSGPLVQPDGSFACEPGAASVSPLRRLSALQYANTVRDLFERLGIDATTAARAELDRVPVDDASQSFRILDARLSDQHVRAYYRVADRLATAIVVEPAALGTLAGDCASAATVAPDCIDAFLDDFGMRAFRRPLTDEERARYHALNDGTRDSTEVFRALVFSILLAPQFLYHVEVEGEGTDERFDLGAWELASRLSYHFWQSMPDDELFAAAADGSLLTDAGFEAQLDRLMEDPRTEDALQGFYAEWWNLDWLGELPSTPAFTTFAEGTTVGEPGADHLSAMSAEIRAMTQHFTFATDGTLRDLFLTDLSFTRSPHLAAIYGVEPWDGTSPHPRLPADERAGLLTRAAFLLTGNESTHPIHRGAVVRRRILCEDLPPPDPASLPPGSLDSPPPSSELTTRERYEQKTREPQCASCHARINPIGFVLERYDGLGRVRDEEIVIDEVTGEVLATLPIDSSAAPGIAPGSAATIDSGVALSEEVVASGKTEGCFARQYFRFTFGREEGGDDGCALEEVRGVLAEGGSLREALRAVAVSSSFRSRRVQ